MKLNKIRENNRGFTIIETVFSIAIFALVSMTLFSMFNTVISSIRNNKAILSANSVAVEQLEIMRGMKFENVGTKDGFLPPGNIDNEKVVMRNGTLFTVLTDITWVDDPFDGTSTSVPADTYNMDYKKVRVRVRWKNPISGGTQEFAATTNIVPEGLEGLNEGRGGIYITVFGAAGQVINQADVTISSATASYGPITGKTDLNGNIWVPDLEPAGDYHIVVTKSGYSTAQTYAVDSDPASADYNPIPEKTDANVVSQSVVKMGFAIDVLGDLNVKTMHFSNPANIQVNVGTAGEQTENTVAIGNGGDLFVAFTDTRDTDSHIYMQKFNYNGGSYSRAWGTDVLAVSQVGCAGPELETTPDGSLYLTWSDKRSDNGDIYLQEFNPSNGSALGIEYAVSHDSSGLGQSNPNMESDQDGNLYIVWEDNRDGSWDIYSQKFIASSSTFWGSDFRMNSSTTGEQLGPKIVVDRDTDLSGGNANNLYVFYQSNHSGNFDVMFAKFDKDHNIMVAEKKINSDSSNLSQYQPDAAYDGNANLYVVWADERDSQPDIYLQKIDKSGNTQFAGDIKVNDDSFSDAWRVRPVVGYYDDNNVYIAWEDNRNGDACSDIYASKVSSNGARQWTYDLIVADYLASLQSEAAIVCDAGGKAVTIWQDTRGGTSDIYGARYSEMGNLQRAGVQVTVSSEKAKGKYPNPDYPTSGSEYISIPKYSQVFTSDANGDIHIQDIEWGGYDFTAAAPYTVTSFDLPAPIAVAPGGTSSIVINVNP